MRISDTNFVDADKPFSVEHSRKRIDGNFRFDIYDAEYLKCTDWILIIADDGYCERKNIDTPKLCAIFYDRENLTTSLEYAFSKFRKSDEFLNMRKYKKYIKSDEYREAVNSLNDYIAYNVNGMNWGNKLKWVFVKFPKRYPPVVIHHKELNGVFYNIADILRPTPMTHVPL